ncbi:MAG: hypothetical protein ABGX22_23170, partial [Pirellulaceae bacterium]
MPFLAPKSARASQGWPELIVIAPRIIIYGWFIAVTLPLAGDEPRSSLEQLRRVTIDRDDTRSTIDGRILFTGAEGGILLESQTTRYWLLQANEIIAQDRLDQPFRIPNHKEFTEQLLQEFPGFESSTTANYVIVHNTTRAYADW